MPFERKSQQKSPGPETLGPGTMAIRRTGMRLSGVLNGVDIFCSNPEIRIEKRMVACDVPQFGLSGLWD